MVGRPVEAGRRVGLGEWVAGHGGALADEPRHDGVAQRVVTDERGQDRIRDADQGDGGDQSEQQRFRPAPGQPDARPRRAQFAHQPEQKREVPPADEPDDDEGRHNEGRNQGVAVAWKESIKAGEIEGDRDRA